MFKIQSALMFVVLLFSANFASAEIYKWVDAQGKIHFSDAPVSGQATAVNVKKANSLPSSAITEVRKNLSTKSKSIRNVAYTKVNKERCDKLAQKYKQQGTLGFSCS